MLVIVLHEGVSFPYYEKHVVVRRRLKAWAIRVPDIQSIQHC